MDATKPISCAPNARAIPQVEGYQFWEPIGHGASGAIWLGRRDHAERPCAVKLADRKLVNQSLQRFKREAYITSLLDHENIVKVYDAGEAEGLFYLSMELIEGPTLAEIIGRLSQRNAIPEMGLTLRLACDVLSALHYAHQLRDGEGRNLRIVHRDLSPRNVMVTYEGETKVIDFGCAFAETGRFRTAVGRINGTPRYMSPQQALGYEVDRRADIYSFAVVLYELLSGHAVVMGEGLGAQLAEVVTQTPPPISLMNKGLPKALDAVFERALAKEPTRRFARADVFANALMDAMAGACSIWEKEQVAELVQRLFRVERAALEERLSVFEQEHGETRALCGGSARFEMTRDDLLEGVDTALYLGPPIEVGDSLAKAIAAKTASSEGSEGQVGQVSQELEEAAPRPWTLFWVGMAAGVTMGAFGLQLVFGLCG